MRTGNGLYMHDNILSIHTFCQTWQSPMTNIVTTVHVCNPNMCMRETYLIFENLHMEMQNT